MDGEIGVEVATVDGCLPGVVLWKSSEGSSMDEPAESRRTETDEEFDVRPPPVLFMASTGFPIEQTGDGAGLGAYEMLRSAAESVSESRRSSSSIPPVLIGISLALPSSTICVSPLYITRIEPLLQQLGV